MDDKKNTSVSVQPMITNVWPSLTSSADEEQQRTEVYKQRVNEAFLNREDTDENSILKDLYIKKSAHCLYYAVHGTFNTQGIINVTSSEMEDGEFKILLPELRVSNVGYDFSGNKISDLTELDFSKKGHFGSLSLANNKITHVSREWLNRLPSVHDLHVYGNPLSEKSEQTLAAYAIERNRGGGNFRIDGLSGQEWKKGKEFDRRMIMNPIKAVKDGLRIKAFFPKPLHNSRLYDMRAWAHIHCLSADQYLPKERSILLYNNDKPDAQANLAALVKSGVREFEGFSPEEMAEIAGLQQESGKLKEGLPLSNVNSIDAEKRVTVQAVATVVGTKQRHNG
jgi:hypothetical protein